MLTALDPASLARMRFPLGELTKPEVRRIAADAGLPVAEQGRLAGPRASWPARAAAGSWSVMADSESARGRSSIRTAASSARTTGQHLFTVGQRRGIGVASGEPLFVLHKDAEHNRVVVGPRSALGARRVALRGVRLHRDARAG